MDSPINDALLQRIWSAHQLGPITTVTTPKRGIINACRIVNEKHVIRFDLLDHEGSSRYQGEQLAYERLRAQGVPVPEVIALDLSKSIAPYGYIILSKMEGEPLLDRWGDFSPQQREQVGRSVGRCLALMHECQFTGFGALKNLGDGGFASWHDDLNRFLEGYAAEALAHGSLDSCVVERMRAIVAQHRPLLEMGAQGRLVHGDYQFENVLVGRDVAAVIDFEWARSGDPAWDFRLEDQWEDECPGSRALLYEGYTHCRLLDPDHDLRVRLYKLLQSLDNVIFYLEDQPDEEEYRRCKAQLLALVESF